MSNIIDLLIKLFRDSKENQDSKQDELRIELPIYDRDETIEKDDEDENQNDGVIIIDL